MTLTKRIIELVPEIKNRHFDSEFGFMQDDISLADVLRAIDVKSHKVGISVLATLLTGYVNNPRDKWKDPKEAKSYVAPLWNLITDLDGQSPECKAFLCKVLGVKETEV